MFVIAEQKDRRQLSPTANQDVGWLEQVWMIWIHNGRRISGKAVRHPANHLALRRH